jgi:hypothetical protein
MKRVFEWWWAILAGSIIVLVVIPLTGSIVDLKITKAQFDLSSLQSALEAYKATRGSFPSEEDGLGSLVGISLGRVATDPWGNKYVYRRNGSGYRVYSRGVDGRDDRGAGDDITTTEKTYRCEDYGVNCPPTGRELAAWVAIVLAVGSLIIGLVRFFLAAYSAGVNPKRDARDGSNISGRH